MHRGELDRKRARRPAVYATRRDNRCSLVQCPGDVIVLGAGGKMGPTLARMVRRAAPDRRRVIAVSRWSSPAAERALNDAGVETVACDLLDRDAVGRLPDAPNVIFMAGQKFGTTGAPAMTWGMNTLVPANCAERYRDSRIVAFSTGNVYALTPVAARRLERNRPTVARRRIRGIVPRSRARFRTVRRSLQHSRRDRASQLRDRSSLRCARRPRASSVARR